MHQAELVRFISGIDRQEERRFEDTMAIIDMYYKFTPTAFTNGQQQNSAEQNLGSCKVFSFAMRHKLSESQTLKLFGQYYQDVLATPQGAEHQNIRQFMQHGWAGIRFTGTPLLLKS
ncbi:HopJ type III effector protein [Shewanella sp. P1-14-1]|uniref:HopJ type III effector protein n=1 Tax=Shewanella sp. P1-14-1 TaxID=1723761 RepID=UPI0006D65A20|nr:HopJ type III effector protein [Shewanella sp. P1-14-1]KPZ67555.1 HopJ type III effector protein [Shewanella sp. P1-14-1]